MEPATIATAMKIVGTLITVGKTAYAATKPGGDIIAGITTSLRTIRSFHSRFSALETSFMNGLQKVAFGEDWRYIRNLAEAIDSIQVQERVNAYTATT